MNDIPQDVGAVIHHADMSPDRDIAMIRRRRRQLAREIGRYRVGVLAEVSIERSARLETRFLIRREPIPGSEARRRAALVLVIPIARGLTGVIVELHGPLIRPI